MASSSSRRITNICVFCGSSSGNNEKYVKAAKELGKELAKRKIHLVYGGGNIGLMGTVAKAAQKGGSQVLGIIPKALAKGDVIGKTIGEELIVSGMQDRILEMLKHSDAFIALPGGLGTLEEIFTIASWAQLNIHQKPIGLLNVNRFFEFLNFFLDEITRGSFVSSLSRKLIIDAPTIDSLLDKLEAFVPEPTPITSKLNWSGDDNGKKRKLDLTLRL